MTREEILDEIVDEINDQFQIESINPYDANVLTFIPSLENAVFPLAVISQIDYNLANENLNKTEKRYNISIEANIFAIDTVTTHKRIVANNVADIVEYVIDNLYGLKLITSEVIPNLVENVYRIVMRFSGVVDVDTKTIYRE